MGAVCSIEHHPMYNISPCPELVWWHVLLTAVFWSPEEGTVETYTSLDSKKDTVQQHSWSQWGSVLKGARGLIIIYLDNFLRLKENKTCTLFNCKNCIQRGYITFTEPMFVNYFWIAHIQNGDMYTCLYLINILNHCGKEELNVNRKGNLSSICLGKTLKTVFSEI